MKVSHNGTIRPNSPIVNRFSRLLGERRLSVSAVARMTGVSRTTLTNLYYDRASGISLSVLGKLCAALECTPSDIFEVQ